MIKVPRTAEEIMARFNAVKPMDIFGVEQSTLLSALDFESASKRGVFAEGVTEEAWIKSGGNLTWRQIIEEARKYLSFFLEKIENERGLSVVRAVMHYRAWKWLLGHDDADTFPGSNGGEGGGYYQRAAYNYLEAQLDGGEWIQKTAAAMVHSKNSYFDIGNQLAEVGASLPVFNAVQAKPGECDTFKFEAIPEQRTPGWDANGSETHE